MGERMRRLAMLIAVGVAVSAIGLGYLPGARVAPAAAGQEEQDARVDERASRLVVRLKNLCGSGDFWFRHEFANGQMRPVRCSRANHERTVLIVYSFSDRHTRRGWLNEWGSLADQRDSVLVRGKRWIVEVLVRRWAREVRERL